MSIQNAIENIIESAAAIDVDDFSFDWNTDYVEIERFSFSHGSVDDVELDCSNISIEETYFNGDDLDDYYLVPVEAIDALRDIDLSDLVEADQAETDPVDVVSIDSIQHVLRDMVMRKRDFAGVWEVIERAQIRDSELASEVENVSLDEAIADAAVADSIEVETDSE